MKVPLLDIIEKKHSGSIKFRDSADGGFFLFWISFICILSFLSCPSYAQQAPQQKQPAAQQPVQPPVPQKSLEEERLGILKSDIQKEIDELKKLKQEIETAKKAQTVKGQESLAKIAKMFEAMPAEDAAKKMEKLDEDTAVTILNALKPKVAGKILAQMEDERAATLSKKLLTRPR